MLSYRLSLGRSVETRRCLALVPRCPSTVQHATGGRRLRYVKYCLRLGGRRACACACACVCVYVCVGVALGLSARPGKRGQIDRSGQPKGAVHKVPSIKGQYMPYRCPIPIREISLTILQSQLHGQPTLELGGWPRQLAKTSLSSYLHGLTPHAELGPVILVSSPICP